MALLTAAIEGVQEAPPDKLAAIQALRTLFLGKVPPTEPSTPQVRAPRPVHDEEPVFIWSPDQVQQLTQNKCNNSPTSSPAHTTTPAIIEEDSDDESLPPRTLLRHSPPDARHILTHHRACSPQRMDITHDKLSSRKPRCHLQPRTHPPANKDMLLQRTISTPSIYPLPQMHLNTSLARSSTTPQVTCSNIDIS